MDKHIPYGIQYGKRVTIDQLNQNERGSNCNCTCEMCGYPLVAIFSDPVVMRPHFRHEKGHIHCHFEYDEYMMNLIFEMLKEIDESIVLEILNNGIEHFSINDIKRMHDISRDKMIKSILKTDFVLKDKKEVFFKVIVYDEEFRVRIICRKIVGLKPEEKAMMINISDIISSRDTMTQDRIKSILSQILSRLSEKVYNKIISNEVNHTIKNQNSIKNKNIAKILTFLNRILKMLLMRIQNYLLVKNLLILVTIQ